MNGVEVRNSTMCTKIGIAHVTVQCVHYSHFLKKKCFLGNEIRLLDLLPGKNLSKQRILFDSVQKKIGIIIAQVTIQR